MGHNPGALSLVVVRPPADLLSIKGLHYNPESLFSPLDPTWFVTIRFDIVQRLGSPVPDCTVSLHICQLPCCCVGGVFQPLEFLLGDGIAANGGQATAYKGHLRGPERTLDR